jgi:hypothetical protein
MSALSLGSSGFLAAVAGLSCGTVVLEPRRSRGHFPLFPSDWSAQLAGTSWSKRANVTNGSVKRPGP